MKVHKKHTAIFVLLLALCALALFNIEKISHERKTVPLVPVTKIANPASEYCVKQGGVLHIEKKENGGEYSLCTFDDNRSCEEWAMLRGDCPLGGRKTTGYDTVEQKYCAWLGGQTVADPNAVCTFKNGKVCELVPLYKGSCQQ